ncbi:alpha/beta hydrolase [candidate division KSB1 bacterium]|nr:alpha/beta hydrolase [candidate division KSB1 bacterium]NIR69531.1 alpha/beta hydrolase [candidate division KSB1 bacterium]NIS24299.1 alpha/beta hydrolase [candidate division KSB1 bacterium]NIT71214.1 alpha/beta hydrolase [candidate division KSB1 bacterium]NIU24918.1 alpha/beta hydrolase [candidate division KSB1 bacterium]
MKDKVNGIDLFYQIDGLGTPVVLLHAFPLNRTMWEPQVQELSNEFQIITPDFRGFGKSGATDDPYTMDLLADDILQLLKTLSLDEVILGGLSMGGYVAFALYRKQPDMVKGLILADTRAEADSEDGKKNRKAMADLAIQKGPLVIAEQMTPKLLGKTTMLKNDSVVQKVKKMMSSSSIAGISNSSLGMALRDDSNPTLKDIACPTLILVGAEDELTPVEAAENLHNKIKNSELQVIPNAGHISNLEQPSEFNNAVKSFLQQFK